MTLTVYVCVCVCVCVCVLCLCFDYLAIKWIPIIVSICLLFCSIKFPAIQHICCIDGNFRETKFSWLSWILPYPRLKFGFNVIIIGEKSLHLKNLFVKSWKVENFVPQKFPVILYVYSIIMVHVYMASVLLYKACN